MTPRLDPLRLEQLLEGSAKRSHHITLAPVGSSSSIRHPQRYFPSPACGNSNYDFNPVCHSPARPKSSSPSSLSCVRAFGIWIGFSPRHHSALSATRRTHRRLEVKGEASSKAGASESAVGDSRVSYCLSPPSKRPRRLGRADNRRAVAFSGGQHYNTVFYKAKPQRRASFPDSASSHFEN